MANNHTDSLPNPALQEVQFNDLDDKLRTLIHTLFTLQSLLHSSSTTPSTSSQPVSAPLSSANASASLISTVSTLPALLSSLADSAPDVPIPPEVLQYVDSARNPDIYTREFVELVQRNGAYLRGKHDALRMFRDELCGQVREMQADTWRGVRLDEYEFLR